MDTVTPLQQGPARLSWPVREHAPGAEFRDALRLALSAGEEAYTSLDKAFLRKAARIGRVPRVAPA